MMISPIDDRDAATCILAKLLRRIHSPKPAAEDHEVTALSFRLVAVRSTQDQDSWTRVDGIDSHIDSDAAEA